MSLATKYRPKTFDEVLGQDVVITVLKHQLESQEYPHCYLFAGPSGDGKTTIARIMANEINKGQGTPIEIDGASNNGVDNIRAIIDDAQIRSIDSEYKIFIIDECHQITTAAWNAFLKCIEEPPKYTIFMFCTTDPQKLPETILNRVMRFNLQKVSDELILRRLSHICVQEPWLYANGALELIVKAANGSVREALTSLERVVSYKLPVTPETVQEVLGLESYDTMFKLTNAIADKDYATITSIVEAIDQEGHPLINFTEQYLDFILDLLKYCIFQDMATTSIPANREEEVKYAVGLFPTLAEDANYFRHLADQVLIIRNTLRNDFNSKLTLLTMLVGLE